MRLCLNFMMPDSNQNTRYHSIKSLIKLINDDMCDLIIMNLSMHLDSDTHLIRINILNDIEKLDEKWNEKIRLLKEKGDLDTNYLVRNRKMLMR